MKLDSTLGLMESFQLTNRCMRNSLKESKLMMNRLQLKELKDNNRGLEQEEPTMTGEEVLVMRKKRKK